MDSHPKKRKKKNQYRANQKSIHGHVVGRENQIQSIQSKSKPNPITQYCNTDLFINQKKKKTQYRENQTPDPEQTKPTVRRRRSRRSQAQLALSLVVLVYSSLTRHSSALRHRRSLQIADRRSVLDCSGARRSASRYFSLFFSFFFFWVRIHGFATSVLCWAWLAVGSGLDSVTKYIYIYILDFSSKVFFWGLKVEQIIFFF